MATNVKKGQNRPLQIFLGGIVLILVGFVVLRYDPSINNGYDRGSGDRAMERASDASTRLALAGSDSYVANSVRRDIGQREAAR